MLQWPSERPTLRRAIALRPPYEYPGPLFQIPARLDERLQRHRRVGPVYDGAIDLAVVVRLAEEIDDVGIARSQIDQREQDLIDARRAGALLFALRRDALDDALRLLVARDDGV